MCGNNIEINSSKERFFVLLVVYVTSIVNASIFGNMAVLIQEQDKTGSAYNKMMDIINEHMRYLKIPLGLKTRIHNYYSYVWMR